MEQRWSIVSIICLSCLIISCSSSRQAVSSDGTTKTQPTSKYYTSAFPHQDVTKLLKEIQQSVIRIVSTAFYDTYGFNSGITLDDIKTNNPKELAETYYSSENSTAGTSIILGQNYQSSLLITCEHIVSFLDTVVTYYEDKNIPSDTYVKSISIKRRQNNLVYTGSDLKTFDIISSDKRLDLALLNAKLEADSNLDHYPLGIESGDSNFLQLGSFLYILGFPKGYAMITRGLASSSESWNDRFFVTDASFNPGISGGLILATNDNYDSFKWVGMASSSNATRENVLVPRPDESNYSQATRPYVDSVFVQQKTRINYGITQAIPINKIKEFLVESKDALSDNGFFLKRSRLSK